MDIRNIKTFYLVATHGSLTRAANQLKLTVPAVSIQLKKLEADVGVKLLHHRPNRLLLTDRGRVFLERVNQILTALEDAKQIVNDNGEYVRQNLHFFVQQYREILRPGDSFFYPQTSRSRGYHPRSALSRDSLERHRWRGRHRSGTIQEHRPGYSKAKASKKRGLAGLSTTIADPREKYI